MRKVSFPWLKNVWVKSRKVMQYRSFETKIWMRNKVFQNALLIKCIGINFQSVVKFFNPRAL